MPKQDSKQIEVKCPVCTRHLDKFTGTGEIKITRKCKSCKNNVVTHVKEGVILSNEVDRKENSKDVLNPNRHRPERANQIK